MKKCIVCATPLTPDLAACSQCHTEREVLGRIESVVVRKRFFFGSIKPAAMEPAEEVKQPRRSHSRSKRAISNDAATRDTPQQPIVPATDFSRINDLDESDVIQNRDIVLPQPPPTSVPMSKRAVAYLIDMMLCLFLDFWVFKLILWLSPRSTLPLLDFSLIPLFFVLLCFTVLYFWLFLGLFKKTLGHLLVDLFAKRQTGLNSTP